MFYRSTFAVVWSLASLFAPSVMMAQATWNPSAHVTTIHYWLHTTNDDRDADTLLSVGLICHGQSYAQDLGVDYGKRWPDNFSLRMRTLSLNQNLMRAELHQCIVRVAMTANGNDEWHFDASVEVVYDDKLGNMYSFDGVKLSSHNSELVSKDLALEDCGKQACQYNF